MELQSKDLFEAVKKEYPDFSTTEIIAFMQAEYLSRITQNIITESNDYTTENTASDITFPFMCSR